MDEQKMDKAPHPVREYLDTLLADENPDAVFFDDLDDALIGVSHQHAGMKPVATYSRRLIIRCFVNRGMTYEEADEWTGHNVDCLSVGSGTPVIVDDSYRDELDMIEEAEEGIPDVDWSDPDVPPPLANVTLNGQQVMHLRRASAKQGWVDVLIPSERIPTLIDDHDMDTSKMSATHVTFVIDEGRTAAVEARIYGDVEIEWLDAEKLRADIYLDCEIDGSLDVIPPAEGSDEAALFATLRERYDLSVFGVDYPEDRVVPKEVDNPERPILLVHTHAHEAELSVGWVEIGAWLEGSDGE
jgi:hypothetical protein